MLKSNMTHYDIVFPLNLGPLTYACPENLVHIAKPGMIVSAPIRNTVKRGILLRKNSRPPSGKIREINKLHGDCPVLSREMLKLLQWMSGYYMVNEGLIIKQTLPQEIFAGTRSRKTQRKISHETHFDPVDVAGEELSILTDAVQDGKYQTFLLHSPSVAYEYSMLKKLFVLTKNIVIILPEVSQAEVLFSIYFRQFKDRIALLHGGMAKGRRSDAVEGIISGTYDIIMGTRSALFAPLKRTSLIIVLDENNSLYKQEEGSRYNMRDVAVMRGFLEKAVVVLSSISPSVDSCFNALTNKYILIKPAPAAKRPAVRITDMRFEKTVRPNFSKKVYEMLKKYLGKGRRIIVVINRRGYSTLLHCAECGHSQKCPDCGIPLVLHRRDRLLKCHYCGLSLDVPDRCEKCGSHHLELFGAGTERIQEEIEGLLGIRALRFDSDLAKKKSGIKDMLRIISSDATSVILGTKMMTSHIGITDRFSAGVIFNIDSSLNHPDFRASEKAYMEVLSVMEHIEPDGELFVQTRYPAHHLFHCLRTGDYDSFVREEMALRKESGYPPYCKLVKLVLTGSEDIADVIVETIHGYDMGIEVLGPAADPRGKRKNELTFLLKSNNRKRLNSAVKRVMERLRNVKNAKVRADVDPA